MRTPWIALSLALYAPAPSATRLAQGGSLSFHAFEVPGAVVTTAYGINRARQIVGGYIGDDVIEHGFLRSSDGNLTTLDVPGATETRPDGINDDGQIVGFFSVGPSYLPNLQENPNEQVHGFVRSPAGAFTTFDVPGAAKTNVSGINNAGVIVGWYHPTRESSEWHGFVRTPQGAFSTVDVPGARTTDVSGISDAGVIVGSFEDSGGKTHGYVRTTRGAFTTLDAPRGRLTWASGITNDGRIIGKYTDTTHDNRGGSKDHGFMRTQGGTFTVIDAPCGTFGTSAYGINDAGQVVGNCSDAKGVHAYLATPSK